MDAVWHEPPVHQEERIGAPAAPPPGRLRDAFFAEVRRLTFGIFRGERWRLRLGPLTLIAFGEPSFDGAAWTWPITGGLLVRHPGGTLRYRWSARLLTRPLAPHPPPPPPPLPPLTELPLPDTAQTPSAAGRNTK